MPAAPAIAALLVASALAACAAPAPLPLPDRPDVTTWMLVVSGEGLPTRAEVLSIDEPFRLGADAEHVRVELLAYTEDLGVPIGPLAPPERGRPLPEPAEVFDAELSAAPRWVSGELSNAARALQVPRRDDCPSYEVTHTVLSESDDDGVAGMTRAWKGSVVLFLRDRWWVVTRSRTESMPALVPDVQAAAFDPAQAVWIATRDAMWTLTGRSLDTATASRAWSLPPDIDTFAITVADPGRVYGLSTNGVLFAAERTGLVRLYQFHTTDTGRRGQVVADAEGVLAAFGEEPVVVRISEEGHVTELPLPTDQEGAVSIARFGEYGIVVGTSAGNLRAQTLGFEPIVDSLGRRPGTLPLRVLEPIDGHLYYGGTVGLFGQLTPGGYVCTSPVPATSSARFIAANEGSILVAGKTLGNAPLQVQLSRFKP